MRKRGFTSRSTICATVAVYFAEGMDPGLQIQATHVQFCKQRKSERIAQAVGHHLQLAFRAFPKWPGFRATLSIHPQ